MRKSICNNFLLSLKDDDKVLRFLFDVFEYIFVC